VSARPVSNVTATRLVVARELREAFRRRSLWIVIAVMFVASAAAMIVPDLLDENTTYDVAVVAGTDADRTVDATMRSIVGADASIRFRDVRGRHEARVLVDDGDVDAAVVIGPPPLVLARAGEHETLVAAARQALAASATDARLRALGVEPSDVQVPAPEVVTVDADDSDRQGAAFALSLVLYIVLVILMTQAATGVAIEKSNRISEVLLAVVKPTALLFGKVIGVGLVGLATVTAAAVPVAVKFAVGDDLPAGVGPAVLAGIAWFVLGLALYLTIAGALGALVERQEEAGSVVAPISILLVVTYLLALSVTDSGLGAVLAIFPLTSPLVMPARIALGEASLAEIVASLAVGIASVVLVVRFGGIVYRRGIVQTGRRLSLRDVFTTR
jgi:ABC-2 type transport system permease protein